jgi:hypothetical protein
MPPSWMPVQLSPKRTDDSQYLRCSEIWETGCGSPPTPPPEEPEVVSPPRSSATHVPRDDNPWQRHCFFCNKKWSRSQKNFIWRRLCLDERAIWIDANCFFFYKRHCSMRKLSSPIEARDLYLQKRLERRLARSSLDPQKYHSL